MEELIKNDGGTENDRKRIRKIEYASNYIDDISYFSVYENITDLNIGKTILTKTIISSIPLNLYSCSNTFKS